MNMDINGQDTWTVFSSLIDHSYVLDRLKTPEADNQAKDLRRIGIRLLNHYLDNL